MIVPLLVITEPSRKSIIFDLKKTLAVLEATMAAIRHYCAYQDRCHSEVRSKLLGMECYGAELEEAISILIEEDFLNEERYAQAYARGKFRMNKWGRIRIKQQLKLKKVSDYCIRKALAQLDEVEYAHTLHELMQKKLATLSGERNEWIRKQKVYQHLVQKGYEPDLVQDTWKAFDNQ